MNKRMREILGLIEIATNSAKAFRDEKKFCEATEKLTEVSTLKQEFEVEKGIFESEKGAVSDTGQDTKEAKANGFEIISKKLRNQPLSDTEKALITGGTNGENLLIPEDVDFAIRELRKQYKSAKGIVNVLPTESLAGGFNFEEGTVTELDSFTDGGDIATSTDPRFVRKPFAIGFKGVTMPISNILVGAEKASLMSYINRFFLKKAILTENKAIFTALKLGKTAKTLKGWTALKTSINKDLDPSALIGARIVTNQTGFDVLDSELDKNGRPILKENPANATEKLFQGLPIEVFSDAELPNVTGKAPIFYGAIQDGCYFIEHASLQFASSTDFLFGKNQTALRVIEGFDVIQADAGAYIYATIEPTAVV